jgi:hypothetical protein
MVVVQDFRMMENALRRPALKESQSSLLILEDRLMLRVQGEGRAANSVEEVGHGVAIVPAGSVFGPLHSGDPLFTCEGIGFVPAEEGEFGEVSLTEVFDLIGHYFIHIKQLLFMSSLKNFF